MFLALVRYGGAGGIAPLYFTPLKTAISRLELLIKTRFCVWVIRTHTQNQREHVTFADPHPSAPSPNLGEGKPSISKSLFQLGRGIEDEGKHDMHPNQSDLNAQRSKRSNPLRIGKADFQIVLFHLGASRLQGGECLRQY